MAQFIGGTLKPSLQQEDLLFMDVFGTPFHVMLSVSLGPTREVKIASTVALMTANEEAMTTYATANGHDLTADLAAGATAIAAASASFAAPKT